MAQELTELRLSKRPLCQYTYMSLCLLRSRVSPAENEIDYTAYRAGTVQR